MRSYRVFCVAAALGALLIGSTGGCRSERAPQPKPAGDDPWATKQPSLAAASSGEVAQGEPAEAPLAHPFFYVAKKGDQTAYLLGTMHMGVGIDALPRPVMEAFASAKHLVVEADINNPALMTQVLRTDGKTLVDDLGAEAFAKFEAIVGGQQAMAAKRLKPAMAATLLQMQGLPQTGFMDVALMAKAKSDGKSVIFLEDATSQLALLEKWITPKAMLAMLDNLALLKTNNAQLLALYKAGDDAGILALANDKSQAESFGISPKEQDAMMGELLLGRNAAWISGIEAAAATGPAFIAVGTLHLLGKGSVNERLQARGWVVERSP